MDDSWSDAGRQDDMTWRDELADLALLGLLVVASIVALAVLAWL